MAAIAMPVMQQHLGSFACGSLQFDFDVDERESREEKMQQGARLEALQQRLAFLQQTQNDKLQRDVRRLMRLLGEPVDAVVLASRLSLVGYVVSVRKAICPNTASCFRNLRHEFLTVLGEDDFKEATYIVDPLFKEQFQIPQPSPVYSAVLDMLPEEFVGTASRLIPLVQCLCAEMAVSFESQGLTLPPWRRAQSMLSKWLPTKLHDISFTNSSSSSSCNSATTTPAPAAPSSSCCSESEGGSPTDTASSSSPFSRISDFAVADHVARQISSKSLLSGKLSTGGSGIVNNRSSSGRQQGISRTDSGSSSSSGRTSYQGGTVSMQPPLYRGQPATYKVKIASNAGALQLPRRQ